jgi:hypothetical protein
MTPAELRNRLADCVGELDEYLDFLEAIDSEVNLSHSRLAGHGLDITPNQQRILYSNVFIQLYNLVENTVDNCLETVKSEIAASNCHPRELNESLFQAWIATKIRTNDVLNDKKLLERVVKMVSSLLSPDAIHEIEISYQKGGNWSDVEIEELAKNIDCQLLIPKSAHQGIKKVWFDNLGALAFVRERRNALAHGRVMFGEGAQGLALTQLRELVAVVVEYLRQVVTSFERYVNDDNYRVPDRRSVISK